MEDDLDFLEEEVSEEWKTTFLDLVMLLLCFFILLASMSSTDYERFKKAVGSINTSFTRKVGGMDYREFQDSDGGDSIFSEEDTKDWQEKDLMSDMKTFLQNSDNYKKSFQLATKDGRVLLQVNNQVFYKAGSADIDSKATELINMLSWIMKKFPDFILHIQGHTDNISIETEEFPSNWELSAIRATNVLRMLMKKGISAKRLTATGYADIFPIANNKTKMGRDKNRRIEFVLETKEF